eukprot:scaffold926_cov408-Prasinococcus_capsulatus_cf.AAC.20
MDKAFVWEDAPEEVTPAWEFATAAEEAKRENAVTKQTTVDQKISEAKEQLLRRSDRRGGHKRHIIESKVEEEQDSIEEQGGDGKFEDSYPSKSLSRPSLRARSRRAAKRKSVKEEAEEEEEEEEEEDDDDDDDGTDGEEQEDDLLVKQAATPVVIGKQKTKDTNKVVFDRRAARSATYASRSFAELNLSRPLLKACEALGYERPTPIQSAVVPLALAGRDICGSAATGSGKTAAFVLPILERLLNRSRTSRVVATRVVILAPTRELAVQVHSMLVSLSKFTDIRAALAVGGLSIQAQATALRSHPEIVVATPGRLVDHLRNTHSVVGSVRWV